MLEASQTRILSMNLILEIKVTDMMPNLEERGRTIHERWSQDLENRLE